MIFLYTYGYLPSCIDHINRDSTDDRPANLRAATPALNARNRARAKSKLREKR
jgi:hypothetical protein